MSETSKNHPAAAAARKVPSKTAGFLLMTIGGLVALLAGVIAATTPVFLLGVFTTGIMVIGTTAVLLGVVLNIMLGAL